MTNPMTLEDLNNIDVNDENQVLIDDDTLIVTLGDGREYSVSLEDLSVLEDALEEVDEETFNKLSEDFDFDDYDDYEFYRRAIYDAFFDRYEENVRAAIRQQFCK